MRLISAARRFDKNPCYDAYSGKVLFWGQLGLYDDTKRDSEASERRVLSCAPGISLPPRGVIKLADRQWIVGKGNPDMYRGSVIRVGYVIHEADDLSSIQTLDQLCSNTGGTRAYAGRAWVKDQAFTEQGSDLSGLYHIHVAVTESVSASDVVTYKGREHIVRSIIFGPAGTQILVAEQMREPVVETALMPSGSWDPLLETWSGGGLSVRAVRVRWQSLFEYRYHRAPTFGPEDIQLAFSKTLLTPQVGLPVTLSDGAWQINSVLDEGVWLCRASRHA